MTKKQTKKQRVFDFLKNTQIDHLKRTYSEPIAVAYEMFVRTNSDITYSTFQSAYNNFIIGKISSVYPYFLKRIEFNKTTDQNFYKITGIQTYIHVSVPNDGQYSISKCIISLKDHNVKQEFDSKRVFIPISEKEYEVFKNKVLNVIGIQETLKNKSEESEILIDSLKTVIQQSENTTKKMVDLLELTQKKV